MEEKNISTNSLLGALGIDFKGLSDEARERQKLLVESYREKGKSFLEEIKRWRVSHPTATLGDSVRALYKEAEEG